MRRSPAVVLVLVALLTGCGEEEVAEEEVSLAEPGPIPASEQCPGDPDRGYDILVNRGYVTCGLPYEAWRQATGDPEVEHALPGREGRNENLPYNLNATTDARGAELVVSNCLTCHAAPLGDEPGGELIVGLGNSFADFTQDLAAGVEAVGLFVEDGACAQAWENFADRMAVIGPYMQTDTVGVNPAPNLTFALMAYRDPETLAWLEEPLIEPPPENPLPTKVPPWWRMDKKNAMFHHGAGRGDHVPFMMLKSLVCTDTTEEAREIEEWFTDVRAYVESVEPPDYPYDIDEELALRGRQVFEQTCAACHGSYGEEEDYPTLLVGLDEVGTDPTYAEQAVELIRFSEWFNRSFYGERAEARPGLGYVAPPLDAVWATAPYLHNASVPTIAALLDSDRRPTYWRLQRDHREYDPDTLGWRYEVLDHGKDGADDVDEARTIYDTTRRGYGNQGHYYGDSLSDEERRAVLEYLKTL